MFINQSLSSLHYLLLLLTAKWYGLAAKVTKTSKNLPTSGISLRDKGRHGGNESGPTVGEHGIQLWELAPGGR